MNKNEKEPMLEVQNLNFGDAIQALKQGEKVSRAGWNGKKMYLSFVSAGSYDVGVTAIGADENNLESAPEMLPWIGMKTADNKFVPWLASQTDVLAEDWCIN